MKPRLQKRGSFPSFEEARAGDGAGERGGQRDDESKGHGEMMKPMTRRGMLAALSYMLCAVCLVLFNKAALSTFSFPSANVITLLQMLCSNTLLFVLCFFKLITLSSQPSPALPLTTKPQVSSPFSSSTILSSSSAASSLLIIPLPTLVRSAPLAASYLIYMLAGMASIRGVSVPMYTTLRRTTVAFTMLIESLGGGQRHSTTVALSVLVIVSGAVLAGARDLSFDSYGYSLVFISNITTAVYLIAIARMGKSLGLNSFGLMWCNGLLCMPAVFFWTLLTGELKAALQFPELLDLRFQACLVMSCLLAFALNFTIFLNTSLNSALTQTMCGNIKDLGTVAFGWLLFGGLPFDLFNVIGQGLGFVGSGLYAYCKLRGK